ncbi:MAG: hypothetical protein WKI04_13065 [Ferruginibacter sp.]
MIAYKAEWLNDINIREQAAEAFHEKCVEKEELDRINTKFSTRFYSPDFFIRIGLFILSTVIFLFSFGLFALLFLSEIDSAIAGLAIFFAVIAYAALEYFVLVKHHFCSGVDDALLWISAASLFGGISYLSYAGDLANCIIIFIITFYCCLRFADRVLAVVLYISLLGIFFFSCIKLGNAAKSAVPFVLMALSAFIYLLIKKAGSLGINQLYARCVETIRIAALLSLYLAGNYFVVRELSNELFNLNLAENEPIPFGWLLWIFTFLIPCAYLARGIQKKDIVLIRVGLLLLGSVIVTVRFYYVIASVEIIMTLVGMVLIITSYLLSRYLLVPRQGFTRFEAAVNDAEDKLTIESILVAQTLSTPPGVNEGTQFGGGNFGGGGTSGDF